MLEVCRSKYEAIIPNSVFLAMDGELLSLSKSFDIVMSNLAFQWLAYLETSILEIIASVHRTRVFSFSIFGPNTMKEWMAFAKRNNFPIGLFRLLNQNEILELIEKAHTKKKHICKFERQLISKTYPDLYSFLREMGLFLNNNHDKMQFQLKTFRGFPSDRTIFNFRSTET